MEEFSSIIYSIRIINYFKFKEDGSKKNLMVRIHGKLRPRKLPLEHSP